MTESKESNTKQNPFYIRLNGTATIVIALVTMIFSAGILYAKVDLLERQVVKLGDTVHKIVERLTRMEASGSHGG